MDFSVFNIFFFISAGVSAGLLSGLLGIGGGTIVVPALAYIFADSVIPKAVVMHMAVGTSLTIMVFTTQASMRAHNRAGNIDWDLYKKLAPAVVLSVIAGTILGDSLSTFVLQIIFGIFLLLVALRMLLAGQARANAGLPGKFGLNILGTVIGLKSGLLGIGGGAVSIPFLIYCGVAVRLVVGMAAALSVTIASIGMVSTIITGFNTPNLPSYSSGYVYWPAVFCVAIPSMLSAVLGAKISHSLPTRALTRIFGVFLLVVAFDMLIRS